MRRWGVPLVALLLAYLLCTFSLDAQSFWVDEAHAFYFVDHPLRETVRLIISPRHNGPLYFLLLWGWRQVAGGSDFALRYLSDLCFVLTTAVLWRLGRCWFDEQVAGLAALLWAIAPFALWYGQEAKMYALHMLLAALSTLSLVRAMGGGRWTRWLAYGVTLNLLGYSHFFGAFTIVTQGVLLLVTARRRARLRYLVTMAVVFVLYLPVVRFALTLLPRFQLQDISKGFMPLHHILQEMAADFTLRVSRLYVVHPLRLWIPLAMLLALGTVEAWRRGRCQGAWVTGWLVLPTLIFYPVSFKVSVFATRYLSASFPPFVLTLALALFRLRRYGRVWAWGGLVGMVCVAGWANVRLLTDPRLQRTDWRGAADYLTAHVHSDDVIVCFADYVHRPLNRYYRGSAPVLRFKANPYAPEAYYDVEVEGRHALWLVLHQDQAMAPHHRLREVAAARYPLITELYPNAGQIAVLGYSVRWRHEGLPAGATPLTARFENGLALVGYAVDAVRLPPVDVRGFHPPSNWLHVVTYWQRWRPDVGRDFAPYVHLVDGEGGVWGSELARTPTVFDFDPPDGWSEAVVEAHYDVNLNPATPPGMYELVVGMRQGDETPIPLTDGAVEVLLRLIEITRQ